MREDNAYDVLEAEERDGAGMEAPCCFSSCSCSSINLMVSFLLLDGMEFCTQKGSWGFLSHLGLPLALHVPNLCGAQNKKSAHFGKMTKKDEPTLSSSEPTHVAALMPFQQSPECGILTLVWGLMDWAWVLSPLKIVSKFKHTNLQQPVAKSQSKSDARVVVLPGSLNHQRAVLLE